MEIKDLHFSILQGMLCVTVLLLCVSTVNANSDIHKSLEDTLLNHVMDGKVDYRGIENNKNFYNYLKALESESSFNNKNDELAYWINAYNALAIKGILDKRSPSTLLGRLGYFKKAKYKVGGKQINLYDLERKVIIPLDEIRIHFAINCASVSCPKLSNQIYQAEKLDAQLDKAAIEFINDPTRNQIDTDKKIAHLSKIFDWFKKDFSAHSGSVQKYVAQYINDPKLAEELRSEKYKIKYLKYNWGLNGTAP